MSATIKVRAVLSLSAMVSAAAIGGEFHWAEPDLGGFEGRDTFTNSTSGHGMFVSDQGVKPF